MNNYPYETINPSSQPEVADEVLNEIFLITAQLEIKVFLAFGTCLGFVRDGGYIEGDNDLDIGIIGGRRERGLLINSLKRNGFYWGERVRHYHFVHDHLIKNKILTDFYLFYPGRFYFQFDYVQYKIRGYPIPHPVKKYLSICYSNWKIQENQQAQLSLLK